MSLVIGSGVLQSYSTTSLSTACIEGLTTFTTKEPFAVYLICLLSFVGWWVFLLFLGVGLSAVPMDLINEFRGRPKKISKDEFSRRRTKLLQHVQALRKTHKQLEAVKETVEKDTGFKGWKNRRTFNRDLNKFEIQCMIAEKEFLALERVTKMSKLEPCLYWLKLLFGLIFIILSVVWIIHTFLWVLMVPGKDPIYPFLNNMLEGIREGHVDFLSTSVFALIAAYLLWAAIKGNIKFGFRFF